MTRQHAQQIWPIIKAYGEGEKIEYKTVACDEWSDVDGEFSFASPPDRYRIVHPEPDLPPGERWSNPEQLTPEQIGEGYRLLTVREHEAGAHDEIAEFLDGSDWYGYKDMRRITKVSVNPEWTYRVPADTPFLLPEPGMRRKTDEERFQQFIEKCKADYKEITGKDYPLP